MLLSEFSVGHSDTCMGSHVHILLLTMLSGLTAHALGDPSVTIEEVTPPVFPSGALFPSEVHSQLYQLIILLLFLVVLFTGFTLYILPTFLWLVNLICVYLAGKICQTL